MHSIENGQNLILKKHISDKSIKKLIMIVMIELLIIIFHTS